MKRAALVIAILPALLSAQRHERTWRVEDSENINRTFNAPASAGPQKLLVDNVNGYVHVTGYSGSEFRITVKKHIGADNDQAMAEAKRDVKLDMSQQGNFVRIYADGPFRNSNGINYRGDDYYGYRVKFDIDVEAPAGAELVLKGLNDGIEVKKAVGDYEINSLNGGIVMQEISGSGSVKTLNGALSLSFSKNPAKACSFDTLNGKMEINFQPGLNADLSFSTLNGGIWSDFEVGPRPAEPVKAEGRNGKFVYRSGRAGYGRAGKGGPELKFKALNGSIYLRSKGAI